MFLSCGKVLYFLFLFFFLLDGFVDEAFFDSEYSTEKSCLLLQFTMDCLHKLFLFDTQKFLSKERAETLMMPLVDQVLTNTKKPIYSWLTSPPLLPPSERFFFFF